MPGKFKIVISDLHLSAGYESEGNLLEDFSSDQEFAALLDEIAAESEREGVDVELIVNGDAFEMLQVPHVDSFDPLMLYEPEDYHSSSEADSALKMALVIDGHRPVFDALGRFLQVGPPRRCVTFIKGNHDLNIYWKAVQDQIRRALAASGGRKTLLSFEERLISREGIYVEHGNQYADIMSQVKTMEEPRDRDDPSQLAIPPGSWFVMDVFNRVERERYWIDGVKPITALVWYALAFDFPFAAKAIATLIRALPGIIRDGFLPFDTEEAGVLDQDWQDRVQVEALASRYESDMAFRAELNAELARVLSPGPESLSFDAGLEADMSEPVAMGDQVRRRLNSSLYAAAAKCAAESKAKLVTFGHTHDARVEDLPGGAVYINSGTWTWQADFGTAGKETWQDLFKHPERFTGDRQLSYIRINYDADGDPVGQLLQYVPKEERSPGPDPEVTSSLWDRILTWFRRLWADLSGQG